MENMENNNIETVETEVVDLEPTETVNPNSGKFNLDPDIAKGVAIIGGCAILAWEVVKWTGRKIGKTKLAQSVKAKINELKKQKSTVEPDDVQDEDTEEDAE